MKIRYHVAIVLSLAACSQNASTTGSGAHPDSSSTVGAGGAGGTGGRMPDTSSTSESSAANSSSSTGAGGQGGAVASASASSSSGNQACASPPSCTSSKDCNVWGCPADGCGNTGLGCCGEDGGGVCTGNTCPNGLCSVGTCSCVGPLGSFLPCPPDYEAECAAVGGHPIAICGLFGQFNSSCVNVATKASLSLQCCVHF